jgi:hypothetical protein
MPPPSMMGLFGAISGLAQQERPMDKIRKAISVLEEAREEDPKQADIISMAIHVLRNGPRGLEAFHPNSMGSTGGSYPTRSRGQP